MHHLDGPIGDSQYFIIYLPSVIHRRQRHQIHGDGLPALLRDVQILKVTTQEVVLPLVFMANVAGAYVSLDLGLEARHQEP